MCDLVIANEEVFVLRTESAFCSERKKGKSEHSGFPVRTSLLTIPNAFEGEGAFWIFGKLVISGFNFLREFEMKKLSLLLTVFFLSACAGGSGSSGGGGRSPGSAAPVQWKSETEVVVFDPTICPLLTERYRTKDPNPEQNTDGFLYRKFKTSLNPLPVRLETGGDFDFVIDGKFHLAVLKPGVDTTVKPGYQGWCERGAVKVQYFIDGTFIGTESFTIVNAKGDVRNILDFSYQGQEKHEDLVYQKY